MGAIGSLRAIRALDITIAIDDYGTGFSSLAYQAKLQVDTLKMDRSFAIEMTTAPGEIFESLFLARLPEATQT